MRPTTRLILAALGSVALLVGVSLPAAAVSSPVLFAEHPSVMAQPASGQSIDDIGVQGDRLYLGYGDYGANTGPLDLAWVSVNTGQTGSDFQVPTEEFGVIRNINGRLHFPLTDPRGSGPGGFATTDGYVPGPPQVHTFDVRQFGGAYFVAGSNYDLSGATVYRSTDGVNWTLSRADKSTRATQDGWERHYWLGEGGGRLLGQADHKDYDGTTSVIINGNYDGLFPMVAFDGARWAKARATTGVPVREAHRVESFRGETYIAGWNAAASTVTDGTKTAPLGAPFTVVDFFATGEHLYAVAADGSVARTAGLGGSRAATPAWERLPGLSVPSGARATAIAVYGSEAFVAAGPRIYRSTL